MHCATYERPCSESAQPLCGIIVIEHTHCHRVQSLGHFDKLSKHDSSGHDINKRQVGLADIVIGRAMPIPQ